MIALYVPGRSLLHRASAGAKLAAMFVLALVISLVPHTPPSLAVTAVVVVALYVSAGLPASTLPRQLWLARWIIVIMVATQLLFLTPWDALVNTLRVVAIVLLASLLTLTTRSEQLLAALETGMRPLARFGVDPRRVGLTLSLAIAMLPVVASIARSVRDAERARGVRLGPRLVVPVMVLALRHADDVADALTARGVD